MPPRSTADAPRTDRSGRAALVRVNALRAMIGPGLVAVYLVATWSGPNRPLMLGVAAGMVAVAALIWWGGPALVHSGAAVLVPVVALTVNIGGSAALSLLDGGIHSPLGAMLAFNLLFYAVMMPARLFVVAAAASAAAYWTVVVLGPPAPPGYAAVWTLGIGGVSYICLRHAAGLASLRRRLAAVSSVDPLTRCLNRRGFDERLERRFAEATRTGAPLTLVVADLDHFKEVNDTYGHRAGDDLLTWTARTMGRELRGTDTVGRLGGDEFAAVLENAGPDAARGAVRRLQEALDGVAPASLGHASYPAEATDLDSLRRLADERAYADKLSRERRAPCPDGVARAGRQPAPPPVAEVDRRERRRRGIVDMGLLTMSDCAVGVVYAVLFAPHQPYRVLIGVLCGLGLLYGLAVIAGADRLSRSPVVRQLSLISAVLMFGLVVVVPVMDGGVASATGLAMLAPMPLIALGVPIRIALPVLGLTVGAYVTVAAALGAPSVWYVVMHLAGILTVSAGYALQGRAAARQRTLLTRLSRVDPLTETLNRRGVEERFAAEAAQARRTGRGLGVLILDLDGFKQLNDSAGHAAGDELLRWVADTLRGGVDGHDVVGRLGGDEFVVLLRCGPAASVRDVAERLRTALAARTSVSIGAAVLDLHGGDFPALYAHADTGLYAEKATRAGARRRVRRTSDAVGSVV
jgi:diguanylate cyclase (GGDEF)-like protein